MARPFTTGLTSRKVIDLPLASDCKPIQAIFFDLGSTLIHFTGSWPEVQAASIQELGAALLETGLKLDLPAFQAEFARRMEAYFSRRDDDYLEYTTGHILRNVLADFGYPGLPVDAIQAALARLYAVSQAHWQPEVDALPTLQALQEAGYRLGLISNASDAADVHALIDKAHLRPFLQSVVISAEVGLRKPSPSIYEIALRTMDVSPAVSVMVGDTLQADIAGAHAAGLRAVWIARRVDTIENRALAEQLHPDAIIHSLDELPPLIKSWNEGI